LYNEFLATLSTSSRKPDNDDDVVDEALEKVRAKERPLNSLFNCVLPAVVG